MSLPADKVQLHQFGVLAITASLYAMLHASRTAWAYSKPTIANDLNYTDSMLGLLDFSFLLSYAIGLFLNGWLGDRLKLKALLTRGMIATIFALLNFALIVGFLNSTSIWIGMLLFIINGFGQATAFPSCMAILANWFPANQRGLVMGAWMMNINLGNIIGQQLGKAYIDILHVNWPYVFVTCGGVLLFITVALARYLYTSPSDVPAVTEAPVINPQEPANKKEAETIGDLEPNSMRDPPASTADTVQIVPEIIVEKEKEKEKPRAIGFWEAWMEPGVILYSIVFICTKASISGLLFWLPTYLKKDIGFHEETAELLACMEVGQLIGVIGLGYISDRRSNKAVLISVSLTAAMVIFFITSFIKSPEYKLSLSFLLFFGGMFAGGPSGLIGGAMCADLGQGDNKEGSAETQQVKATSTITGIIDGSGTVGAAAIQPIIPLLRHNSFLLYTGLLLIGAIVTPFAHMHVKKNTKDIKQTKEGVPYLKNELDMPAPEVEA